MGSSVGRSGAWGAAILLLLLAHASPASAAAIAPLSQLRSSEVNARVSSDTGSSEQIDGEASYDPGPFDGSTSARAELDGTFAQTQLSYLSDIAADGVTLDARLDSTLSEATPSLLLASTGAIVFLSVDFEVTETTPFRLAGLARASALPAEVQVRLSDASGVLFELQTRIDPGDPLAGFDEPFAASGTFHAGSPYELLVVGVGDVFLPTTGSLSLETNLLLIPELSSGALVGTGLWLLCAASSRRRRTDPAPFQTLPRPGC